MSMATLLFIIACLTCLALMGMGIYIISRQGAERHKALRGYIESDTHIALDKRFMVDMVKRYVEEIETGETMKLCRCAWIVHPDDVNKPEGKRRIRPGTDQAWDCPVHTREGYLLYFTEWAREKV